MARVTCVYLPSWSIDRFRRVRGKSAPPPETPFALVARVGPRRLIMALNEAAADAGVRPGQTATHAYAIAAGLVLEDLDAKGDADALERLALWAQRRYSPIVAVDGASGLVLDTSGCDHLFGGEEKLLIDLRQRLVDVGYSARVVTADTWGGAHALARFCSRSVFVVRQGGLGYELKDLPIAALRLPATTTADLLKLGFDTVGELDAARKGPITRRFGLEPIRRLDQAFGREAEPITPVIAADTPRVARVFAEPIGARETMERYVSELTAELCIVLEAAGLGALQLDALFTRVDNRIESARIGMAAPSREAGRLAKLLCEKLDKVDPGFGVERILLAAPGAAPLAYSQTSSVHEDGAGPNLAGLVDALSNRLGGEKVYRLASVESDLPERCVRHAPALDAPASFSWPVDWPRPTRLLSHPEPIEVVALLPDAPPGAFTWRQVRHRVARGDGPERVYGEWWRSEAEFARSRDYYRVENEAGERFWLFRDGDGAHADSGSGRWFMHGIFS